MPTYEYRCPYGHAFELFQRMSDEPVASCPTCGAESTRLLSAGAGFLFKGDGFYITDYRSDDYRKAAKAESGTSGASASDAASSGTGSESPSKAGAGASGAGAGAPSGAKSEVAKKPASTAASSSSSSSST